MIASPPAIVRSLTIAAAAKTSSLAATGNVRPLENSAPTRSAASVGLVAPQTAHSIPPTPSMMADAASRTVTLCYPASARPSTPSLLPTLAARTNRRQCSPQVACVAGQTRSCWVRWKQVRASNWGEPLRGTPRVRTGPKPTRSLGLRQRGAARSKGAAVCCVLGLDACTKTWSLARRAISTPTIRFRIASAQAGERRACSVAQLRCSLGLVARMRVRGFCFS